VAFIRKKRTTGGTIYQVVESRREGRKVHQKVLVSLGHNSTIAGALQRLERRIASRGYSEYWQRQWAELKERLKVLQQQTGLP
jgi:hypothetical protein